MSNKYPGGIITSGAAAGYSVFFDGSGDELNAGSNSAFAFGTGAYTVEFWTYLTVAVGASHNPCFVFNDSTNGWGIYNENGSNQLQIATRGVAGAILGSSTTLTANVWNHVVAVRSGTSSGQTSIFVNGTRIANGTDATNWTVTGPLKLGGITSSGFYLNGYMSNVRVVKGTAVYDPTQTSIRVPTQLFNITNTSLLTCNSPAIVDQSSNAFTITANGNAAVSTFTPFQGYVAYNPALGAATPGIWTVSDAIQAAQTRRWNMYDPYFNLTTLLLHGNGTNGAQNNTFLDSSSNNFTITRNGNTTQGTFSPFSQTGWSVNNTSTAPGSTNLYTIANNAALQMGTGDFTVELWVYITGQSGTDSYTGIFSLSGVYGTANTCLEFTMEPNGGIGVNSFTNTTTNFYVNLIAGNSGLAFNRWNHLAVCRSGTNVYAFTNGILQGTVTGNSTNINGTGIGAIFLQRLNSTTATPGYLSNVRVVKGTALYTSSFTPSTAPLTAVTNTTLLTCQSNRFIDNSTNNFAITVNSGFASVQAFSPFYPVVAYTPQAQGGSGYFDGTGDYLTGPNASGGDFSTGSFTISCWFYPTTLSSGTDYGVLAYADASGWNGWQLLARGTTKDMKFEFLSGSAGVNTITGGTIVLNAWNYVVVTRSGSTVNLYVNSTTSAASATNSTAYGVSTSKVVVGADRLSSSALAGYISNVKLVKQANTPSSIPTAPDTNTTNTSLLCNFTNAGVLNSTADSVVETVNTAQISTAQSKFGGSSLYFDGTNNTSRLRALGQPYNLYSGDFTVELWYYPTAHNTTGYPVLWTNYETWISGAGYNNLIGLLAGNKDRSPVNAIYLTLGDNFWSPTTTVPSLNTWTHIALVRTGNRYLIFINGVKEVDYAAVSTITFNSNSLSIVGGGTDGAGLNRIYGYIDDFRQTNYARYTGNFTPQTSQWQDQ